MFDDELTFIGQPHTTHCTTCTCLVTKPNRRSSSFPGPYPTACPFSSLEREQKSLWLKTWPCGRPICSSSICPACCTVHIHIVAIDSLVTWHYHDQLSHRINETVLLIEVRWSFWKGKSCIIAWHHHVTSRLPPHFNTFTALHHTFYHITSCLPLHYITLSTNWHHITPPTALL